MKNTILILSLLFTAGLAYAGDPIPGVDVSIEQIPGGTYKTESDCVKHGGSVIHKQGNTFCHVKASVMKSERNRDSHQPRSK